MIKYCRDYKQYYKDNISQIKVKKRQNNDKNIKMSSPELSHQENNYFYNTKINRLILQEAPNNSIQNIYHQPIHHNKRLSIGYDLLEGNSKYFQSKKLSGELFIKNSSYQNLPLGMKLKPSEDNDSKDINRVTYINFKNNKSKDNSESLYYNNKPNNAKLLNTLRVNYENNNQDFNKKDNSGQNIKYNYHIKNYEIPDLIAENNNYNISKNNIKYEFNYPRMVLSQDKVDNNEFNHKFSITKQEFYKKKNNINKANKDEISKVKKSSPCHNGYIYLKHNQKNISLNEGKKSNNTTKGFIMNKKNKNNKMYDDKKLEKFCEILEEIYFLSFKSDYNYFIHNIKLFSEKRNMSKFLILRRYDDTKKFKEKKRNKSMLDINVANDDKYKEILNDNKNKKNRIKIYDDNNMTNSPSKYKNLENNLTNSMIKINNAQYNRMINNIFKIENYDNKESTSPLNERKETKKYKENSERSECYNKYNTNTNTNNLFSKKIYKKFNDVKIDTQINSKNKYLLDKNIIKINLNTNNNNSNKNHFSEILSDNEIYLNKSLNNNIQTYKNNKNININKKSNLNNKINYNNLNINSSKRMIKENTNNSIKSRISILYSKPLNKKYIDNFQIKENNKTIIENIENNRNNFKSSIYSKNNRSLNYQNNELDLYNYDESNEIIIKNVQTQDKRLFVFIKYIPLDNIKWKTKYKSNNNYLFVIHTDSFKIIKINVNNKKIFSKYGKNREKKQNNSIIYRYNEDSHKEEKNDNMKNSDKKHYNKYYSINETNKNVIIYLFSLLQNIYNDNKKQALFNFFKTLKKIKRTSLFSSMKLRNKNHYIRLNINPNNNNLIKDNNFQSDSSNVTRNRNNNNNNDILYNKNLSLNTNLINSNFDNTLINESINFSENKEIKFKNIINNNKTFLEKANNICESDKEKIERKKLAKLEKIIIHLNKENDIINSIKEQFLDWTNKNEIKSIYKNKNEKVNADNTKTYDKYEIKTFDNNYLFNDKRKKYKRDFEEKINKFRYKLMSFCLKCN